MNKSMKIKKYHNKILKHMNTFGVAIYHILIHCIGSKLGLYVSFQIPLYLIFEAVNCWGFWGPAEIKRNDFEEKQGLSIDFKAILK